MQQINWYNSFGTSLASCLCADNVALLCTCSHHISGGLKGVRCQWSVPRWRFLKAHWCLLLCQIYLSRHLVSSCLYLPLLPTTAISTFSDQYFSVCYFHNFFSLFVTFTAIVILLLLSFLFLIFFQYASCMKVLSVFLFIYTVALKLSFFLKYISTVYICIKRYYV